MRSPGSCHCAVRRFLPGAMPVIRPVGLPPSALAANAAVTSRPLRVTASRALGGTLPLIRISASPPLVHWGEGDDSTSSVKLSPRLSMLAQPASASVATAAARPSGIALFKPPRTMTVTASCPAPGSAPRSASRWVAGKCLLVGRKLTVMVGLARVVCTAASL